MANIQDYLTKILKERYGKDVRQSIHDAIQQCYLDGKAGSIDLQARESIEALESAKLDKSGDTANNITVFSSGDNLSPTGWANIEKIESGETHASLFRKFSLAVKNLRYLYKMLGTTDISAIGDGTVTGAISGLNNGLNQLIVIDKFSKSGVTVNATKYVDCDFEITKSRYTPIGIVGFSSGNLLLEVPSVNISNGKAYLTAFNTSSENITSTMKVDVLYIKNLS